MNMVKIFILFKLDKTLNNIDFLLAYVIKNKPSNPVNGNQWKLLFSK